MLLSKTINSIHPNMLKLYLVSSSNLHTTNIYRRNGKNICGERSVAVILSGCGALDGTEISEAISVAIHCSNKGFSPTFYAPDVEICEVVDHCTKQVVDEKRHAFTESARLARSDILPLCECKATAAEGLIIPGGFGAAKTLSDFATEGSCCKILPELEEIIEEFYCCKKPIGTICIAAALVARVLDGVKVTLGKAGPVEDWPYCSAIEKVKRMGAKVEQKDVKSVTHCKNFNVFSTPSWMYNAATYKEIHYGIGKMVTKMNKYMK